MSCFSPTPAITLLCFSPYDDKDVVRSPIYRPISEIWTGENSEARSSRAHDDIVFGLGVQLPGSNQSSTEKQVVAISGLVTKLDIDINVAVHLDSNGLGTNSASDVDDPAILEVEGQHV